MQATLLTIGDELLIGQVVNTNAAWLGEHLGALGAMVRRMVTVGDDDATIGEALSDALADSELVVCTGGLGPTHDDRTVRAVAAALGRSIRIDGSVMADVEAKFAERGRRMAEANRRLAEVPEGFTVLPNPVGTAPGLWGEADGRVVVVLPGVPREMKALVTESVAPRLAERIGEAAVAQKTLHTVGEGESDLAERLGADWEAGGRSLAFLPNYGVVRLRLTATSSDRPAAERELAAFEALVRDRLGDLVYGENGESIEAAVVRMLAARGLTVALAESCTGGRIADALTNVPGASRVFQGAAVVYGNDVKASLLDVPEALMIEHGAVSDPVARAMAAGVRDRLGASLGLSATGIAGPGGGTPEKPVGTVWLGFADEVGTHAVHLRFTPDRELNKRLTTTAALNLLRRQLLRRKD